VDLLGLRGDVLKVDPLDALQAVLNEAKSLEPKQAVERLEAAPEAVRGFGSWHYARGGLALRLGDTKAATTALQRAVELEPEVSEFHSNLGAAWLERAKAKEPGALKNAREALERAVELGPRLPDAWSNLALAKLLAKDPFGAVSCADRALEMDAGHVAALYNKAAALDAQGLPDECVAVLDELLKIAPDFAPALESRRRRVRP
jgi:tetratricopeptide (TPR) repeat protein